MTAQPQVPILFEVLRMTIRFNNSQQRLDVIDVPLLKDLQYSGHVALGDEPLVPAMQRGLDRFANCYVCSSLSELGFALVNFIFRRLLGVEGHHCQGVKPGHTRSSTDTRRVL